MKIVILDAKTLGNDIDLSIFSEVGEVEIYQTTMKSELEERVENADIIIVNKIQLNRDNLKNAKKLKLICITATGYDNIDIDYCWKKEIGVCNVKGYSTYSVTQVTLAMVLELYTHLNEYTKFVRTGQYTASGVQNCLYPTYGELYKKTWGVVGLGNIGRQVATVAKAFGCNVIAYKRGSDSEFDCVDIDTLCKNSDIISVHLPLYDETKNLINARRISLMKKDVVFINVARGAIIDEEALTCAIEQGRIGGIGVDVYSNEPFDINHCYNRIIDYNNVILTPHMAWAAYESRIRCVEEILENIKAFYRGEKRNRIEL